MFHRKKADKDDIKIATQAKVNAIKQEMAEDNKLEDFYNQKMYQQADDDLVSHIVATVSLLEAHGMLDKKALKNRDDRHLIMVIVGYIMEHYRNV